MAELVIANKEDIVAIADEIRTLSGATDTMGLDVMATNIDSANSEVDIQADLIAQIQTALESKAAGSEPTLQAKTATPSASSQTITPDSGYDGLSKVIVEAVPTATQATPSIEVSSSGLITASSTQLEGYVTEGTKSATKQLTTQATQTITPSTIDQTITSGKYLTGTQTIKGDTNLIASNIKSGVSIFGVSGSYEGSGSGSGGSVETCTVTFRNANNADSNGYLGYVGVDETGAICLKYAITNSSLSSIQCVQNTLITICNAILDGDEMVVENGLCGGNIIMDYYINYIETSSNCGVYVFQVTGEGWIDISSPESGGM